MRLRPALHLRRGWLLTLPLALGACSDGAWSAADLPGGLGDHLGGETVPPIREPEREHLRQQRVFTHRTQDGSYASVREVLWADGAGHFRLDLVAAGPAGGPLAPATPFQVSEHERRQRYLIHYRDLHLRDAHLANQNYSFEPVEEVEVAGRPCITWVLRSRHGRGSIEADLDAQTNLLLGWRRYDPSGVELASLATEELELAPSLDAVRAWSQVQAETAPYRGPDDPALGFEPLVPRLLPEGFDTARIMVVLSENVLPDVSNMHVEVVDDGILPMFIAQQTAASDLDSFGTDLTSVVRHSYSGGVRIFETRFLDRMIYLVGAVSADDMRLVLGALDKAE